MPSLRDRVMSGGEAAAVHGIGYIGASSAAFLRARGVRVVGIDPDAHKLERAIAGKCPVAPLEPWLAAAGAPFRAIDAFKSLVDVPASIPIAVHHVCVPTEAEGAASDAALHACVGAIAARDPGALVVVESTVAPPYIDAIYRSHPGLRIVAAPRRDWFDAPDKSLRTLPRIVGCDEPDVLAEAVAYLKLVCDEVVPIADAKLAALVKIVENGLRQVELAYANELAVQIGHEYDVRRLLELAATKWNIGLFRPSIGVSGYCIPLAGRYASLLGRPLSVTAAAIAASAAHIDRVVDSLAHHASVDFWGMAYKANAPFSASSSAAVWIADALRGRSIATGAPRVRIFASDDGERQWAYDAGHTIARWIEDAGGDALVIPVAHQAALALNDAAARATIGRYKMVLDNEDALRRVAPSVWAATGTEVRVPGTIGWLAP